ncbi:hypothetical protein FK514_26965, partial [Klebsiella pneumoniae]|nr:hypothetical protein [Klebsiella pneumoniae]
MIEDIQLDFTRIDLNGDLGFRAEMEIAAPPGETNLLTLIQRPVVLAGAVVLALDIHAVRGP